MASGTGLEGFASRFPARVFDVGIAEGHAASMAAGLASQGMVPVFAVYSTFLQRSYDTLLHDVAISQLHVVFGVDRAGIVGADGETHQGIFDVGYLTTVPGMTIYSPASFGELRDALRRAVLEDKGPVAVRYPRGGEESYTASGAPDWELLREGEDVTIVTYGSAVCEAIRASELLAASGIRAELLKLERIWPLEPEPILRSLEKTGRLCVLEECVSSGCIGEHLAAELALRGKRRRCLF
jgi:1-deoxy-D-xylulose-5-phosphate synthase